MGNAVRRADQQHGPHQKNHHHTSEEEWLDQMERDRKEGRVLLRQMVTKSDDVVDWKAVIDQAESLHKKEHAEIKKRLKQQKKTKKNKSPRLRRLLGGKQQDMKNNGKKTAKTLTTYNNQVVGSFSVNLMTMRPSLDDDNKAVLLRWRNRRKHGFHSSSSSHLQHHGTSRTTSAASSREEDNDEDTEAIKGIVNASRRSNDRGFDTSSIIVLTV